MKIAGVLEKGHRLICVIAAVRLPTGTRKRCFGSLCASPKFRGKKSGQLVGPLGVQPFGSKPITHRGGGEGNRTPVRKHFNGTFSGRRRLLRESSSLFPSQMASRHAICSGESHHAWASQLFPAARTPHQRRLPRPVASPVQTAAIN